MKSLKLFSLLVILIGLNSCSKKVEFDSPVQADIRGVWSVVEYSYEGRTTTLFHEDQTYYDFNSIGWEMHFDVVFSDSPNSYSKSGDYFLDNYFINDEGETFFYESYNVFDEQGTWEINGNVVTITINGDSFNAGISELTEERLILRINTTTTEVEDDFITTHSTVRNETYVFERD
ncbi:MAG: hypothetical protein HKN54_03435 [Flavobacteriaceae bacterium]|nr:hypothetical protein [Flavobacteriaceae bacterium]